LTWYTSVARRDAPDVNDLARHTGWLHGAVLGYADFGVVLFAALLLAGVLLWRTATGRWPQPAGRPWPCSLWA
jgi:hypothetical protein